MFVSVHCTVLEKEYTKDFAIINYFLRHFIYNGPLLYLMTFSVKWPWHRLGPTHLNTLMPNVYFKSENLLSFASYDKLLVTIYKNADPGKHEYNCSKHINTKDMKHKRSTYSYSYVDFIQSQGMENVRNG